FNKVTSTFRHPEVPNTTIKLLLFPFSLEGESRIWLDKEPPRSILMWEDLVSKFINQFFPPSKTTYLWNEITNFLQKPNERFNEAWERFKDLLRQCPHHGFLGYINWIHFTMHLTQMIRMPSIPQQEEIFWIRFHVNVYRSLKIAASFEDKLDIRMNRFEKSLNDMKNSFVTPTAPLKVVEESLLREDPIPPHPIISNQTKLPIEEPKHSFKMGHGHFNTNLVTNDVAESSTKNLIPIPHECVVVSENRSQSTEPVNDNSSIFTTISNPLFDNDKINSDEINSHVEFNFDESTSNHHTVKSDYLDEFYGPFIPIHILKEERIRREHADYINRMEIKVILIRKSSMLFPLQMMCYLQHEYSKSEDFDFDNPSIPLPPPKPPDEEFDFEINLGNEILVVRSAIVKFEYIDARVKFDVFNDENNVLSYFMFAKKFSLLSVESEDMIFDPGISD
nr:reverse transcriptase domain-containing protein [Tanacetum cinerariifolium]